MLPEVVFKPTVYYCFYTIKYVQTNVQLEL